MAQQSQEQVESANATFDAVDQATTKTILVAGLTATLLLLLVIVLESFFATAPLLSSSRSAKLALTFSVMTLVGVLLIGLRWVTKRWALYLFTLPCVATNFFLVDASGGLTGSPFISFYPCLLSVAIIVAKRPLPVLFVGFVVTGALAVNGYCQYVESVASFVAPVQNGAYLLKYYGISLITLAIMGLADWTNQGSPQQTHA